MRILLPLFFVLIFACEKNADVIQSDSCGEYTIYDTWSGITATIEFDFAEGSYFLNNHIHGSFDGLFSAFSCDLLSLLQSGDNNDIYSATSVSHVTLSM